MLNYGLAGRTVVVTGGASGIGFATARLLVEQGANVAIIDLQQERVDTAVTSLGDVLDQVMGFGLDVTDDVALKSAATDIENRFGPCHGLVVCAGVSAAAPAEDVSPSDWDRVMRVNAFGAFLSCQVFGRQMIRRQNGSIVAIGSIDGLGGQAGRTAYVASKFAVNGIVKNLAIEWGRHGVRVNCIAPTLVETPLLHSGVPMGFIEMVKDRTPMGRIADASDIAAAALMMLSDAARLVTGTILPVDGGLTAGHITRRHGADLSSKRLLGLGIYIE